MRTAALFLAIVTMAGAQAPAIRIWHGTKQIVGHLGPAQDDFNLMGEVRDPDSLVWLAYRLNGAAQVPLSFRAFRRLALDGNFNADIPIAALKAGSNEVRIVARWRNGETAEQVMTLDRVMGGSSPLPYETRFLGAPQATVQIVDGEWAVGDGGLRTVQTGHERMFVVGEKSWQDYEVRTAITVRRIDSISPVQDGGPGVGFILRFAGHQVGGPRLYPSAQPKFGTQPFGGAAWIRWNNGDPASPPMRQFVRGDRDQVAEQGTTTVELNVPYEIRLKAQTFPDPQGGVGLTEYSFKMWKRGVPEPPSWDWQSRYESWQTLRRGAVAFIAHHADVTFGNVRVSAGSTYVRSREQALAAMEQIMGPRTRAMMTPPRMQVIEEIDRTAYVQKRIRYLSEGNDWVPAYLLMPKREGPLPAMLCLHQTTRLGKGEPAGIGGLPDLHYAQELAERGYVAIAPDYPSFGDYKIDAYALGYVSATMKGIHNHRRAVDLLVSMPEVDARRIGVIGHSLGGHNSLFVAAFDERIKAAVTSCGFTSVGRYFGGDLTGWSHLGYMPRVAELYGKEATRMPFDYTDILAAIAPRAVFVNAPTGDGNFDVTGVRNTVALVDDLFRGKLDVVYPEVGHTFPPAIRNQAYQFLDIALGRLVVR